MKLAADRITRKAARLAFISYASEDKEKANLVKSELESSLIRIWIDEEQMLCQEHTDIASSRIWDGLASCTDFVALVSSKSLEKPWVNHEWKVASARWLASGEPKIYAIMIDEEVPLPELPYLSLLKWSPSIGAEISQCFLKSKNIDTSINSEELHQLIVRLRSQFLIGGSTAVQAIHRFDSISDLIKERIDSAAKNNFSGEFSREASWLRMLGLLLDLRAEPQWLIETLTVACNASGLEQRDINILRNNLGTACTYAGLTSEARGWLNLAARGCIEDGDRIGAAMSFGNLALLEINSGRLCDATQLINKANHELAFEETQLSSQISRNLHAEIFGTMGNLKNHQGRILAREGKFLEAYECFADHLAIGELSENRRSIGIALARIAWLDLRTDKIKFRTHYALLRYLDVSVASFNPLGAANAYAWLGQFEVMRGNLLEARLHFNEETKLRAVLGNQLNLARAICWRILVESKIGLRPVFDLNNLILFENIADNSLEEQDELVVSLAAERCSELYKLLPFRKTETTVWRHPALKVLLN